MGSALGITDHYDKMPSLFSLLALTRSLLLSVHCNMEKHVIVIFWTEQTGHTSPAHDKSSPVLISTRWTQAPSGHEDNSVV